MLNLKKNQNSFINYDGDFICKEWKHYHVKADKKAGSSFWVFFCLLLMVMIIGASVSFIHLQNQKLAINKNVAQTKTAIKLLKVEIETLEMRISQELQVHTLKNRLMEQNSQLQSIPPHVILYIDQENGVAQVTNQEANQGLLSSVLE